MIGMLFCVTRDRRLGLVVLRTWKSRRGHPTIPKEVDGFIDKVLVHGEPWGAGNKVEVTATYVFVCAQLLMLVVIRDAMSVARSVGQTERRNWNKVSSIREGNFLFMLTYWRTQVCWKSDGIWYRSLWESYWSLVWLCHS